MYKDITIERKKKRERSKTLLRRKAESNEPAPAESNNDKFRGSERERGAEKKMRPKRERFNWPSSGLNQLGKCK